MANDKKIEKIKRKLNNKIDKLISKSIKKRLKNVYYTTDLSNLITKELIDNIISKFILKYKDDDIWISYELSKEYDCLDYFNIHFTIDYLDDISW